MRRQLLTSLLSLLLLSSISNSSAGCRRSPSFSFKGTFCNKEHATISANLKCTEMVLELRAGKHRGARECLCSSLANLGRSAAEPGAVAVVEKMAYNVGPRAVATGHGCTYHAVAHCCYDLTGGAQSAAAAAGTADGTAAAAAPTPAGSTAAAAAGDMQNASTRPHGAHQADAGLHSAAAHSKKQQNSYSGNAAAAPAAAMGSRAHPAAPQAASAAEAAGPLGNSVPSVTRSYATGSRGPLVNAPVAVNWWTWDSDDSNNVRA